MPIEVKCSCGKVLSAEADVGEYPIIDDDLVAARSAEGLDLLDILEFLRSPGLPPAGVGIPCQEGDIQGFAGVRIIIVGQSQ